MLESFGLLPDNYFKTSRSEALSYLIAITSIAEYSTVGTLFPLSPQNYNAMLALLHETSPPYNGVPPVSYGAETMVHLINDYTNAAVATIVGEQANVLAKRYDVLESDKESSVAKRHSSWVALLSDITTLMDDAAHLTAARRLLVSSAQTRIYSRISHGNMRFNIAASVFTLYVVLVATATNHGWQNIALACGFLGGASANKGTIPPSSCAATSSDSTTTATTATTTRYYPPHLPTPDLLPCVFVHTDRTQHDLPPWYLMPYVQQCNYYESMLWEDYITPPVYRDCEHEEGHVDFFVKMFVKDKPSENVTRVCETGQPVNKTVAMEQGMPQYWDAGIKTDPVRKRAYVATPTYTWQHPHICGNIHIYVAPPINPSEHISIYERSLAFLPPIKLTTLALFTNCLALLLTLAHRG